MIDVWAMLADDTREALEGSARCAGRHCPTCPSRVLFGESHEPDCIFKRHQEMSRHSAGNTKPFRDTSKVMKHDKEKTMRVLKVMFRDGRVIGYLARNPEIVAAQMIEMSDKEAAKLLTDQDKPDVQTLFRNEGPLTVRG